ncbi:MAG: thioredoxin [Lachnospiraceae bacterium]|nr:thioredoxin [Lachnospiraceae bacterium]
MEYKFTSENFEKEVLQSDIPVMVDFYADWCGPCRMMGPVVASMAEKYEGKIKIGKLNVDDEGEIAGKYGVASIPTFIFFKGGQEAATCMGAMSAGDLEAKISQVLE